MPVTDRYSVVAAKDRSTGDVVYLTGCDEWSPDLHLAELIDDAEHADFRLFVASRQDRAVAAPRLAEVRLDREGPVRVSAA